MSSKTDQRAKEILRLLLRQGKTSDDDLTDALGASPASIRRDLTRLEETGLVHRTHGGAMLANAGQAVYEPFRLDASFHEREDRFTAEKMRIARAAAELVREHETIGFAAGTTTTLIARQLLNRRSLHVITNAVNIGMELGMSTQIETTLTGGLIRWADAFSLVGAMALESLSSVVMDRLFLSVTGIDAGFGATIIQPDEASVFRTMVRHAREVVVVADSSKLGLVSPSVICPLSDIDLLITDSEASPEVIAAIEAEDVAVMAV